MCLTPVASANLKILKSQFAKKVFGMTMEEAWKNNVCIHCGKPIFFINPDQQEMIGDFHSFEKSSEGEIWTWDGANEYKISALCEHCFEKITRELEESGLEESEGELADYGELS